ncbi:MAG TPA: hypothetical protein VGL94_14545 [Ktedonobacteraceae bacterium]
MPNQVQVQTYTTCGQDTFPSVLQHYWEVLSRLGCTDQQVRDWLTYIPWPASEDDAYGDVYASPVTLAPVPAEEITCAGIEVSLYIQPGMPTIEEPPSWVNINLLLDIDQLKADFTPVYKPGSGRILWRILSEFSSTFPEIGVYFTDEWQENQAWRTIVENSGDPWAFDLAIFPRTLAKHFEMVPAGFQGTVIDGGFGFAPANRWSILPWVEAETAS